MSNASYYDHLLSWWAHRHDPDVLFLFFEDLKAHCTPAHAPDASSSQHNILSTHRR